MQAYCASTTEYKRLATREVRIGDLLMGNFHPIRMQTMTTTDTMDTLATVEQSIRCIEAGAELVRITAPSKKEAENLLHIKNKLRRRGYTTPLVADIHFTPNAAEIAARIVEKVRVNPGNYVDKKKFELIEYTDADYAEEIERIYEKFTPLVKICKEYGTAMRIGTNHGSLSDRIMSRYGDTPMGMVESAMEFLRIARGENFHNIVLSMKASNPQVMVQAYRLLVHTMDQEFGECYPLHLGVTEAGDGEDGRIKSAVGIGTLLQDGLGDTIRVSLTEDPELEIPVCKALLKPFENQIANGANQVPVVEKLTYDPFNYKRRNSFAVSNIGGTQVPVVVADLSKVEAITPAHLESIGYSYDADTDKWAIADTAADYVFTGHQVLPFALPGTLKVLVFPATWAEVAQQGGEAKYYPLFQDSGFTQTSMRSPLLNFVMVDCYNDTTAVNDYTFLDAIVNDPTVVLCLSSERTNSMQAVRRMFVELDSRGIKNPAIIVVDSKGDTADDHLIKYASDAGALLLEGYGDGVCFGMTKSSYDQLAASYQLEATADSRQATGELLVDGSLLSVVSAPRTYLQNAAPEQFINNTAFSILQATRTRISKTEYISCPSCGRTLFDLQETTARIRAVTNHLKGVKIAIMGCIVNGPGEMADADFGYVGSGPGKITLYKGKEVVKRNVPSEVAVEELINLLKENEAWIAPLMVKA
ncbi:4-hydroxy-3-methylbut-2-en-1-yl diphosphate synthase [Cnuella takakiae]|uniref:4-hydroxy-3-methylbut-2-en-1-yl diphosphate synthase (flavodoxin) n=1 Tax=Cnuella takakiae TaxID=1302690 RepID=A0A1M5DQ72_9BACT|nr:(E)-4-hydroxy-3-methylbut-2-enyl-diphosphate synthase [Cnuella takakiae]OLY93908.1 1-hydroxy-2-methyl-2-(E)-butenyl 4-diphosphate synthase [Cnuella takakiae]SHF69066.1 4-hydroxy-3-methylbut-2-en-1-yl diphosphate synthase [Cnuella takakiae]